MWSSDRMPRAAGTTGVHAFDAAGRYLAGVVVPGYVPSRAGLSARDGYLRVVTSTGPRWVPEGEDVTLRQNSVVVLAERSGDLAAVGRLDRLAPGEQIGALHWLGPLLAVTPNEPRGVIHLVDLSRPTHLRLRRDLPAGGLDLFVYRLQDDRFLAVGQDGPNNKRDPDDLTVSTYDLAASRTAIDSLAFGHGGALAEYEPRAFAFLADRALAVVPGTLSKQVPAGQVPATVTESVPGVLAVRVDPDGRLHVVGKYFAEHRVLRVFVLGDRLVVVTGTSVVLLDPDGLRLLGSLKLAEPSYWD